MSWLVGLLLWSLPAVAGEFYFEGPVHEARADAVASSRAAREAGHDARVVRRYSDGVGWEYLVRVSGITRQARAAEVATELTAVLGGALTLYRLDEPDTEAVEVALEASGVAENLGEAEAGTAPARKGEGSSELVADALPAALEATIVAHGGVEGGVATIDGSPAVLFEFQRTLPDGAVVGHAWARQGASVYAEVQRVSGEVTPSRTLVTADGAWVGADGGALTSQDRERTLETIQAFSPASVVPFVLSFAALADERKELQSIRDDGTVELDGRVMRILRSDGDQASGPLVLYVDAETARVRKVDFDQGAMVVEFDDWPVNADGPILLPGKVRTWREGTLVDSVEILKIDLEPDLPNGWFEAP